MLLLKEFFHEALVVFGGGLHQGAVQLHGMIHLVGRDVLDSGSTAVGAPGELFHEQHVDERVEAGAAHERILHQSDTRAKYLAHLLHDVFKVGLLAVHLVEGEDYGLVKRGGGAEYILCADFDAILAVDDYHARIGHAQGCHGIAHEVVGARAVYHVELLIVKLGIEYGREYRVAVFLLHGEIVADRRLGLDGTAAFYHATLVEHCFCERGLTRAFATKQGYVFDFVRVVCFHAIRVF